jgi:hypothetical protein
MDLLDLAVPAPVVVYCDDCHHPLWTPESRKLRLGPDCAEKRGISLTKPYARSRSGGDCEGQTNLLEENT